MKYLRWLAAALVAAYVAFNALPLVTTVLYKLGRLGEVPADARRYVPLMDATAWWQVAVWALALGLFAACAVQLVRGARAMPLFALAFVIDMANFAVMRTGGVYTQVFSADELMLDYYIITAMVAVGGLIWWSERGQGAPSQAPA